MSALLEDLREYGTEGARLHAEAVTAAHRVAGLVESHSYREAYHAVLALFKTVQRLRKLQRETWRVATILGWRGKALGEGEGEEDG